MKHEARVDEVERARVELREVWTVIEHEGATRAVAVQVLGELNHAGRDVDAVALGEPAGERAREPTDTAPEVERPLAPTWSRGRAIRKRLLDLRLAADEERLELPAAVPSLGRAEDRPQRIDPRKLRTIARLGGDYYCRSTDLFEMRRPQ